MPDIWVVGEIADGGLARISTEVSTLARGLGETAGHDEHDIGRPRAGLSEACERGT